MPWRFFFFRLLAAFFRFFVYFLRGLEILKNRLPKNMPQTLQSRTPDRPNVAFGIDFGSLFASFFHQIFVVVIICANHQNAFIHNSSVG